MDGLSEKLDRLRRARTRAAPPAAAPPVSASATRATLAAIVGGADCDSSAGACWRIQRSFDEICPAHGLRREQFECRGWCRFTANDAEPTPLDWRRCIVVDIETGGLAGTPVFLVGAVALDTWPLQVEQWLVRDYPEESAILAALASWIAARDVWITFNGRSFDEPFLRDRAVVHRTSLPPVAAHWDLLHAARRRWRGTLPNCRLETLERHILQQSRVGDVPGADAPDLFHHFIKTGNARPLRGVVEHNQRDLVSSVRLAQLLTTHEAAT